MRADDGEVEAVGLEDVLRDALHIFGRYLIDCPDDLLQRPYPPEAYERCHRVLRDLITRFE